MTVQKTFPALGTVNTLFLRGSDAMETTEEAKAYILSLEQSLSVFRPDSEVSVLNRQKGGRTVPLREETMRILEESVRCGELTEGAFDITAVPLSMIWKKAIRERRLPDPKEIRKRKRLVGYRELRIDPERGTASLHRTGQSVDFGGIAKGWAADRLAELLGKHDIEEALLNLGGTVLVCGGEREIGIQDPFDKAGRIMGTLKLRNGFAVTSGSYEQGFTAGGIRYHHIIDPRTGFPAGSGLCSVTLTGDQNAAELDVLATAAIILGEEKTLPILRERGIEGIFVRDDGKVFVTAGLAERFRLQPESVKSVS